MSLANTRLEDGVLMNLRESLKTELDAAEAAGEELRAATLRLVQCAVRDRDIKARRKDECLGCDETEILAILQSMAVQREAAADEYEAAGKIELAEQEREEAEILREFLPKTLEPSEILEAAEEVVAELDAKSLKDVGRCVTELKSRFPNQIESGAAKAAVKKLIH